VALLDEILEVARYMDQNEGRLPPSAPPVITSGHPSLSLSPEEVKAMFAGKKARKLAEKVMGGDEQVCVSDSTFKELGEFHRTCKQVFLVSVLSLLTGLSHLIFFCVPPHLQPVEGGGSVKGVKRNS
jgi:hypothetical protein